MDIFWALVRMIVFLPLVAGLAYLVVKYGLARKMILSGRRMRIVERMPLGPRASLNLVEIGNHCYLIADEGNNVTLLKEFDTLPEVLPVFQQTNGQFHVPPPASLIDRLLRWHVTDKTT